MSMDGVSEDVRKLTTCLGIYPSLAYYHTLRSLLSAMPDFCLHPPRHADGQLWFLAMDWAGRKMHIVTFAVL